MIHTYHERVEGGWKCRGENHQLYYRERTDPWIQKYKEEQNRNLSPPARKDPARGMKFF